MADQNNSKKPPTENLSAMSLGITMAVGMAFFAYIGYILDQKTGGGQLWTLAGIFLGLFYCGYEVWKLIKKTNKSGPPG